MVLFSPILLIIALGGYWTYTNPEASHISLRHVSDWLPDFSQSGIGASFTAVVLSLTGIEITTAYANEVKNPQKAYPKALLVSTINDFSVANGLFIIYRSCRFA